MRETMPLPHKFLKAKNEWRRPARLSLLGGGFVGMKNNDIQRILRWVAALFKIIVEQQRILLRVS